MSKHTNFYPFLIFIGSIITLYSCTKINDATTLGAGLIPAVDNVNTFDTSLDVQTYNGLFTNATDSTKDTLMSIRPLGLISNDPLFGKSDARLFFEMKPSSYPYTFLNRPDSLVLDSVVLVLGYHNTYGDSTAQQTVNVYEIAPEYIWNDTVSYKFRTNNINKGNLLGSRTFIPKSLNDSIKVYKDTTAKQLRIKLSNSFGQRLLKYDTAGALKAYFSDSLFRTFFRGFALECTQGNAIMNFDLAGSNTKLAIYYRDLNGGSSIQDTAVTYFGANGRQASYIIQAPGASPYSSATSNPIVAGTDVFIQSTPGSYATIKIPGLNTLTNRVIYRAELVMEQIYDASNATFAQPDYLYVDAYDSSLNYYRTIPFDFVYNGTYGTNNFTTLGSIPITTVDPSGRSIKVWKFDLTRFVQNIANGVQKSLPLRVTAPLYVQEYHKITPSSTEFLYHVGVNSYPGQGRVKLGGGNRSSQKMRLRIIYSKI